MRCWIFRLSLLLAALTLGLAGCINQPRLTQYRAVECLKMSMVYQNLARDAGGPVELSVKRDDENRIQIVAMAHGPTARSTIARFRVDPDRRIFQYNTTSQQWTWISTCD